MAWLSPAFAKRAKPVGAYISSAKIAIVDGRPAEGIVMLDSLLEAYGPHAEAYYWRSLIEIDLMEASADLEEKKTHVELLVSYSDSLHSTCGNKDIKKKYRDDCDEFMTEIDSLESYYWKVFYNDGVTQIQEVRETVPQLQAATDSAEIDYFQNRLDAKIDSCIDNMQLAILIDPADARTYTGISSAYETMGEYETATEWLNRALPHATDSTVLLQKIAYNYISMNQYCDAITPFDGYVNQILRDEAVLEDPNNKSAILGTMYNLSVCLNNCGQFDSAYTVLTRMYEIDSTNIDVLIGRARYHNQMARYANDSANYYSGINEPEKKAEWTEKKNEQFETAFGYLQDAFNQAPDSAAIAGEFALTAALLQKFEQAAQGFEVVTAKDPNDADSWTSLGDCYIALKEWQKAADAYEHTIELQPDNESVMDQLVLLYEELGNDARKAEIEAMMSKEGSAGE
ncbi:tetratricopeptide repeat protein [candidate division GN15 bacterium]|nr:tetratricopeptide repeat protein [candidate division GN15 bacterium]